MTQQLNTRPDIWFLKPELTQRSGQFWIKPPEFNNDKVTLRLPGSQYKKNVLPNELKTCAAPLTSK